LEEEYDQPARSQQQLQLSAAAALKVFSILFLSSADGANRLLPQHLRIHLAAATQQVLPAAVRALDSI
jgi:hypothetical protein